MPDAVLQHLDYPLHLPVSLATANSDIVVDYIQPFAELCKASSKLGAVVHPNIVWLALLGNYIIIEKLSCASDLK